VTPAYLSGDTSTQHWGEEEQKLSVCNGSWVQESQEQRGYNEGIT